jgi:hypothetical protein
MKCSSIVFCATVAASILVLGSRTSYAQSAWRCQGEDCQDALISDIEDLTTTRWPALQSINMPGLPYFCRVTTDTCPHCFTGGDPAVSGTPTGPTGPTGSAVAPHSQYTVSGTVPWSLLVSTSLRSFLVGRFTASADVFGTIRANNDNSVWSFTDASYVFQDACDANGQNCAFVQATGGGSTGVADLGALAFAPTTSGSLWSSSLTFTFTVSVPDNVTSCDIGYDGAKFDFVRPVSSNTFSVSYPVAWTPIASSLADAVRNQFRQSARIAVTGSP